MKVILLLVLATSASAQQVPVPAASLAVVGHHGAQWVSTVVTQASQVVNSAVAGFNTANTQCDTYVKNKLESQCVPCLKQKCKAKADSCGRKLTFVEGAIKSVGDFGGRVTSTVKDTAKTVVNTVVDTGKKVVNTVTKVFKGWGKKRALRVRRAEPSCDEIKNNAGTACQKYASSCPSCTVDKNRECTNWRVTSEKLRAAQSQYSWMNKIAGGSYPFRLISASYDASKFDVASGGYRDIAVQTEVLGKPFSFTMAGPLNPYDAQKAGPMIAAEALNRFKTS